MLLAASPFPAGVSGENAFLISNGPLAQVPILAKAGEPAAGEAILVDRTPVSAALTKDERFLLVAHGRPAGRADTVYVAADVSVIDVDAGECVKKLCLPNGSGSVKELRISPDGKIAALTHLVARFGRPATHLDQGWLIANALTFIDVERMEIHSTVLLDNPELGAADPWGLAWSDDSSIIVITHAGTHEVSIIDFKKLLPRLLSLRATLGDRCDPATAFKERWDLAEDLPFLTGGRRRVKLPKSDKGPRSVAIISNTAWVTNYFSRTVTRIELSSPDLKAESIPLGPQRSMTLAEKGELYFHDATFCFQQWLSCSSCHPDARADGLNWDLLNDGRGNPKNTKSLLLAHRTPPAMSLGVRDTAETAVRSGLRHILFSQQPEEVALAIDEYLKSLKPAPSPHLVNGALSPAARSGEQVFNKAGCADCHPAPLYTDLQSHDIGTRDRFGQPTRAFDTPTLIELWRTAPYFHDGSAATVREVITSRNPQDRHGTTSSLSSKEIVELCEYLLSL